MFGSKILITGIYGSGKTTLAHNLVKKLGHTYINFDKMFKYGTKKWQRSDLAEIHAALRNTEFAVIDALPKLALGAEEDPDWDDLITNYDTTVVVVKCSLETWAKRCPGKKGDRRGDPQHYIDFYRDLDEWLGDIAYITYNSDIGEFEDE